MQARNYLDLVDSVATRSLDPSTHIGAVLVTQSAETLVACNDIPFYVKKTPERNERPAKYLFYEHAERNVIYEAAREGIPTRQATLYTTGIPCADCARAVVQAGISHVVVWKRGSGLEATDRWYDSIKAGGEILRESGVSIVEVDR